MNLKLKNKFNYAAKIERAKRIISHRNLILHFQNNFATKSLASFLFSILLNSKRKRSIAHNLQMCALLFASRKKIANWIDNIEYVRATKSSTCRKQLGPIVAFVGDTLVTILRGFRYIVNALTRWYRDVNNQPEKEMLGDRNRSIGLIKIYSPVSPNRASGIEGEDSRRIICSIYPSIYRSLSLSHFVHKRTEILSRTLPDKPRRYNLINHHLIDRIRAHLCVASTRPGNASILRDINIKFIPRKIG